MPDPGDFIDDVTVVIVAGGEGTRLGSRRPKAFAGVCGRVMLAWSIEAFEQHEAVDSIVLVVPEEWVEVAEVLVDDLGCDRVSSIEVGGSSRAASVRAGLAAVSARRQTAVLVHDAARPFVADDLVDRVLAPLADGCDAVVPALAVADTVKRVDPATGEVVETVPRGELRLAQTPQACRASVLAAALDALDEAALAAITDDAQAVADTGGRVICVAGDARTMKITTPDDLRAVEELLVREGLAAPAPPPVDGDGDGDDHEDDDDLTDDDLVGADVDTDGDDAPAGGNEPADGDDLDHGGTPERAGAR